MTEPPTLCESLRQTAQAARVVDPGPWRYDGRDIFTDSRGGFADHTLILPLPETWHESQRVPDAIARHVAACDPSTIVSLIDRLAALEELVGDISKWANANRRALPYRLADAARAFADRTAG